LPDSNEPNENPTGEELTQARTSELERLVAEKDEELRLANARISELEQMVASLEGEVATLGQSSLESEQRLAEASSALSQAVASYKALVVETNPAVPPELVTGDTIEAINNSLKAAEELVNKVRGELEAEIKMVKIPAGAPQRVPVDLSALSSREKIQYGIGGKR
jgi:chromosome segregation ATPase